MRKSQRNPAPFRCLGAIEINAYKLTTYHLKYKSILGSNVIINLKAVLRCIKYVKKCSYDQLIFQHTFRLLHYMPVIIKRFLVCCIFHQHFQN
jgi:site-specific DNA-cytosine methylase